MTNFERLTASPDTLGAFLASIPVASAPWDDAFHREYCAGCPLEDCEPSCPHQDKRGNPCWWLAQTAEATPSDKDVASRSRLRQENRSRFKGLDEMTDEEINAFAGCFYRAIQSMREVKRQQQQNS